MNIWKAPIDGGTPVRVTDRSSEEPIVSPDQKWILFSYWGEPERPTSGIAIIPFEGGAPVKRFEISNAHWGADASTIQYVSRHNDIDNIWEQPVAGGPARQVTHFDTGQIFSWRFSRDRKQLAMSRGRITQDVILIRNFK
jgi:hypothetical protein